MLLLGWLRVGPGVVAFRRAEGRIEVPLGFFIWAILRACGNALPFSGGESRRCEFPFSCPLRPLALLDVCSAFFLFLRRKRRDDAYHLPSSLRAASFIDMSVRVVLNC